MTVPAPKLYPLPAAMIALAIAAAPSAEASDSRRILRISDTAVVLTPGVAAGLARFAVSIAPDASQAASVMATASAYDAAVTKAGAALKDFHVASSGYAAAAVRLSALAWSGTQSAVATASALNESSPERRAALARAGRGAQAVFDSVMTIADLAGSYVETQDEGAVRLEAPASAAGIAASYSAAASGLTAFQRTMTEKVDLGRAMQALDDLSHDVLAVIGPSDVRAIPRNTAFIQIKAAKDALADLSSMTPPHLDMMAITNLEILRLAGRGL